MSRKIAISAIVLSYFLFSILDIFGWSHLGEARIYNKMEYLKSDSSYNCVIIGSSQVLNNFIPEIIDEYADADLKTFNLGRARMFALEAQYITKEILREYDHIEHVILLAHGPPDIAGINRHVSDSNYFMDEQNLSYSMKYFKDNIVQKYYHLESYLENKLSIGNVINKILKLCFTEDWLKRALEKKDYELEENLGFDAADEIDSDWELAAKNKLKVDSAFKRKIFVRMALQKKKCPSVDTVGENRREFLRLREIALSPVIKEFESLNKIAVENNKNLYLMRLPNHYSIPFPEELNEIYLGDGCEYPELFDPHDRIDFSHLTRKGAEKYSRQLGLKLKDAI